MAEGWLGKRVLVTGATGFIGSHLVRRLTGLGSVVHAVSRRAHADGGQTWHVADLCDADQVSARGAASVEPATRVWPAIFALARRRSQVSLLHTRLCVGRCPAWPAA